MKYIAVRRPGKLWHIGTGSDSISWKVLCRSFLAQEKHEYVNGVEVSSKRKIEQANVKDVLEDLCFQCVREAYAEDLIDITWKVK